MEYLIMTGYELMTVLCPAGLAIGVFCAGYRKKKKEITGGHIFLLFIFAVYLFGVFHFTGSGTVFDIKRLGMEFHQERINLIPFSGSDIDYVAYGLNVVLFMPLGFLLPLLCTNLNKMKYACTAGFLLSLLVEISQLLNFRATDVDDLLLNTVGAIIGFWICRGYTHIANNRKQRELTDGYDSREIFIVVFAAFLGHFFLFNEMGAASLLYGF